MTKIRPKKKKKTNRCVEEVVTVRNLGPAPPPGNIEIAKGRGIEPESYQVPQNPTTFSCQLKGHLLRTFRENCRV